MDTDKITEKKANFRPLSFEDFVGQESIKKVLKNAIVSSKKRKEPIGHVLFSGESGFGKTTLAQIVARQLWVEIKIVTAYAIEKPADIISVLNWLKMWDILFIDEIHRLKPKIEEMLYIAMEDFRIDIVMPDGGNLNLPLPEFTLIWATTKLESLSSPFKNRFVYKFHFSHYTKNEKQNIVKKYLNNVSVTVEDSLVPDIAQKVLPVPREIRNFTIKLRDWLMSNWFEEKNMYIDDELFQKFSKWIELNDDWLSHLQLKYLEILKQEDVVWVKTLSQMINVSEQVIEIDIEPMLLKLWKIEKTSKGRRLA